jgi:DNA-binding transcriptional MerR regulator/methylmalonyl-CoA mutase cobalamin-binding subunit
MYTIKQAASRAGVSVPLLRQWERRYGVVRPARTASGYRTYDDAAIARVRAMRQLVDEGWAPNAAAASIQDLDDAAVTGLLASRAADATLPARPEVGADDLTEAFQRAAATFDSPGLESVLDEMFARGTFEQVAERYLVPTLRRLGDAWAAGEVDVAAEHAASHAIWRRLAIAYQASGLPSNARGIVLVGLPPGSHHELGALMFSIAARRAGLPVMHLGADLPGHDWLDAARRTDAAGAVVGVVSAADIPAATEVVELLHDSRPGMLVAVGGQAADEVAEATGALRLPAGLTAAVDAVRGALTLPAGAARGRAGQP